MRFNRVLFLNWSFNIHCTVLRNNNPAMGWLEKAQADTGKTLPWPERRGSEQSVAHQGGDHTQQDLHIQETYQFFHFRIYHVTSKMTWLISNKYGLTKFSRVLLINTFSYQEYRQISIEKCRQYWGFGSCRIRTFLLDPVKISGFGPLKMHEH
jgi:hypothetical protein